MDKKGIFFDGRKSPCRMPARRCGAALFFLPISVAVFSFFHILSLLFHLKTLLESYISFPHPIGHLEEVYMPFFPFYHCGDLS